MNNDKYLTISALTKYIKYKFDSDENLKTVFLKGEISNFKSHSTGHYYFSLKDDTSKINAIMFSINTKRLNFVPVDGMKVLVAGRISIYEATGNYQIYIEEMIEDGVGNLYIAFEKLKEQLSEEGLFDPKHKKKIPNIPDKIGVITAPTGAAIKDIISTIKRRYPLSQLYLFPSLVQGENAANDIVRKIKQADSFGVDVLIIGRGGGSIEDLWPFNEEIVARAIYACNTPIISAVGHEIDYTISDFVADLRAPTPTGAAELAVPNINDILNHIKQLNIRLSENIFQKINYQKLRINSLKNTFIIKNPNIIYDNQKQKLDLIIERMSTIIHYKYEKAFIQLNKLKNSNILINPKHLYKNHIINLNHLIDKLEMVNPLNILKRGYNLTYKDNKLVKSIKNISNQDNLKIRFHDGNVEVIVNKIMED